MVTARRRRRLNEEELVIVSPRNSAKKTFSSLTPLLADDLANNHAEGSLNSTDDRDALTQRTASNEGFEAL